MKVAKLLKLPHVLALVSFIAAPQVNVWAQASKPKAEMPKEVKQMLYWEFETNAFNNPSLRKPQYFDVEHFEIPYELADEVLPVVSIEASDIKQSMVFEKGGKKYLRWVINPEDTKFTAKLEKQLDKMGLSTVRHKYFKGGLTASRSLMIYDPINKNVFTAKVSTNNTGGAWKDKSVSFVQVEKARIASNLVKKTQSTLQKSAVGGFKFMLPEVEPIGFAIQKGSFEQGMVMRDLLQLGKDGTYFMPGFAVVHEKAGKDIAAINGSTDPGKFWRTNFAKPLGHALGEYAAYHGLTYASAHSQQFLLQLDADLKPTGKIVLRDFNDSVVLTPFYNTDIASNKEFLEKWILKWVKYRRANLNVRFEILRGGGAPSWINEAEAAKWRKAFFAAFEETFSKISGVDQAVLAKGVSKAYSANEGDKPVFKEHRNYQVYKNSLLGNKIGMGGFTDPQWADFFSKTQCFQGFSSKSGESALSVLAEVAKRLEDKN